MKTKYLILIVVLLVAVAALFVTRGSRPNEPVPRPPLVEKQVTPPPDTASALVPAHYEQAPSLRSLGPTLAPEKFPGKTREAYHVAKDIPQTLAQLPCYCHCDRGMGHKSLHSCFEDDHAAHCATCTDEALMAYRLQKEQHLSAKQIREQIIAQFSDQ
jgi:uncharacterized protein with PCYCGC motif